MVSDERTAGARAAYTAMADACRGISSPRLPVPRTAEQGHQVSEFFRGFGAARDEVVGLIEARLDGPEA